MAYSSDLGEQSVLAAVSSALGDVAERDCKLLKHSAHELSMVHRFGIYFEQHFQPARYGLAIDTEYDRYHGGPKRMPPRHDRPGEFKFRPDLVVHHRGDDENNLLVLEWKKGPIQLAVLAELTSRVQYLMREDVQPRYSYKIGIIVDSRNDHICWRTIGNGGPEDDWQRIPRER